MGLSTGKESTPRQTLSEPRDLALQEDSAQGGSFPGKGAM